MAARGSSENSPGQTEQNNKAQPDSHTMHTITPKKLSLFMALSVLLLLHIPCLHQSVAGQTPSLGH